MKHAFLQFFLFTGLLLFCLPALAQNKNTVSGYVRDAETGEALVGVNVLVQETSLGSPTNLDGFYSITLEPGTYNIEFSYISYQKTVKQVKLNKNVKLDVALASESKQLQEVEVTVNKSQTAQVQSTEMSIARLDIKTIQKLPAFMGEADVIKSLQQLPGVSTVGEGASGFNVRGGSVGQNLILQDGAPVYNSSHMLGFFSAFNPDAVSDVKLYKGGVPPRFGGRLASILDIQLRDGDNTKYSATGGIGTVFSRLSVEGPIVKEKGSFILSARRSYIDILARPFVELLKDGGALNFYDVTGKVNYKLGEKDRVYLSGYAGRDVFMFDKEQGFNWGNKTATLRWNHLYSSKLVSNVSFVGSNYNYELNFGEDNVNSFNWKSQITNYIFKPEISYFFSTDNELNIGAEAMYYTVTPADAKGVSNGTPVNIKLDENRNLETGIFANHNVKLTNLLSVSYGLRYSHYQHFGPGTAYTYNDTIPGIRRTPVSSEEFGSGKALATYSNFEPRVSAKMALTDESSVKASYNRMVQYLHFISNTTASTPLDVWAPSTKNTKPQTGDQFTLGYFRTIQSKWEVSAEAYLRLTKNQVDYIDGADLLFNEFLEGDMLNGEGRAYGLELYLQRTQGRFTGWVGYTLARTELKVQGINNGDYYPTRYDQTHNVKVSGFYDLNKRLSVSGNFVFNTGTPTTFPTSRYVVQGVLIPHNATETRNNVRLPAYHRLDLSVRLEGRKISKKGKVRKNEDYWVFSVYNVYARKNPFSIYFSQTSERTPAGQPLQSQAKQISIIGSMVPSVSYNFKF